jgi:hypothetical protein
MAFAKRRNSHCLHAERQTQKQQQGATKLAGNVHGSYGESVAEIKLGLLSSRQDKTTD